MLRIAALFLLSFLSLTSFGQTSSLYQVDLLLFSHQNDQKISKDRLAHTWQINQPRKAIALDALQKSDRTPYHLLPNSSSQLRNAYWALNRKSNYRVIAFYSWLQPSNNLQPVSLPLSTQDGWTVEGTLRIRQLNYYALETNLLFTQQNSKKMTFVFKQKQRLKPNTIYYLDHPLAGMLIKIHKIG